MNAVRLFSVCLIALFVPGAVDAGQQKPAPEKRKSIALDSSLTRRFALLLDPEARAADERVKKAEEDDENKEQPRSAKQVAAPASTKASGSVVDAPSFVQVIGLAVDNDLIGFKDGAFTVDLNAFAFAALFNADTVVDQNLYGKKKNVRLRRLGGSITLGGKGEEFDSDGDGEKDNAKEAESLADILQGELRWRFAGSRDRRDRQSLESFRRDLVEPQKALDEALGDADRSLRLAVDAHDTAVAKTGKPFQEACGTGKCLYEDRVPDLFKLIEASPELKQKFLAAGAAIQAYEKAHVLAIKNIDRSAIWTAIIGGTRQGPDFGPRRLALGVRGLWASGEWDYTINVDWGRADWGTEQPVAYSGRFGFSGTRLLTTDPDAESGPKLTLAANAERFRNVPGAKHNSILTIGIKVEVPFSESITVPFSVNYANHADLLGDQKRLSAHVGLAWDFSGLTKKKKED